jgi:hypothetical protein
MDVMQGVLYLQVLHAAGVKKQSAEAFSHCGNRVSSVSDGI